MFGIFLCLLTGAFFVELFRKYILGIKDPDIHDLWKELDETEWFKELMSNPELRKWILSDKEKGLLKDPYYVRKIIDKEGHRDGFINYIQDKSR
ncbi:MULTISPECIES: hypothetical protein [unclassified Bacillus (in: firmicutes)]|uniref:hypothetical protein n=1 Tax=unclassified Bacillus (in: firmicutes) TaxID=185979 RepID=UPI0008F2355A|nr:MULTISPECIES: hypothetical protein [unclassified Bacillus (in: firmicutes)]SFB11826.1 hypothetical protein SAMN02799634_10648 [Bacillus sp. UNCCL13]SFQ90417.1 hypothetical protein SAMN04488577_3768 [Bacillus sp. cl95]